MIPKSITHHPRLVLDTNICLDLFVFRDSRWAALLAGLRDNRLEAITKHSCREEWLAVLHYPKLPVTDEKRATIIHAFDTLVRCENPPLSSTINLPLCSDPKDQQFMEIARDAKATHLITKDKALLQCGKKVARFNLFQILSPEVFIKMVEF